MVVQMAKAVGAKVVTTVGSGEKAKLARELGADHVVNYKTGDVAEAARAATAGRATASGKPSAPRAVAAHAGNRHRPTSRRTTAA